MFDNIERIITAVTNDPKLIPAWAKLYRKMVDELVALHFSPEEAIKIVTSSSILPGSSSSNKEEA